MTQQRNSQPGNLSSAGRLGECFQELLDWFLLWRENAAVFSHDKDDKQEDIPSLLRFQIGSLCFQSYQDYNLLIELVFERVRTGLEHTGVKHVEDLSTKIYCSF